MTLCYIVLCNRDHSFSTFTKFSEKRTFLRPLIHTHPSAYQGVRNVSFFWKTLLTISLNLNDLIAVKSFLTSVSLRTIFVIASLSSLKTYFYPSLSAVLKLFHYLHVRPLNILILTQEYKQFFIISDAEKIKSYDLFSSLLFKCLLFIKCISVRRHSGKNGTMTAK